jgi:hypothetical protein
MHRELTTLLMGLVAVLIQGCAMPPKPPSHCSAPYIESESQILASYRGYYCGSDIALDGGSLVYAFTNEGGARFDIIVVNRVTTSSKNVFYWDDRYGQVIEIGWKGSKAILEPFSQTEGKIVELLRSALMRRLCQRGQASSIIILLLRGDFSDF